jgi:RHS repeat-associated protein
MQAALPALAHNKHPPPPYLSRHVPSILCLFTGKERDAATGLDNFGARYNSSSFGRFMSPDPENAGATAEAPQSWNAYAYVLGNPLNYTDPFGLDCIYKSDATDNPYPGATGTVTILRGDCANKGGKDDSGVFVDGRIDTDSPIINDPRTGDLNFGLSKGAGYGSGVALNFYDLQPPPDDNALTPDQVSIFGAVYRNARIVESGPLWAGCTAIGGLLGQPPSPEQPATHVGFEALAKGLGEPKDRYHGRQSVPHGHGRSVYSGRQVFESLGAAYGQGSSPSPRRCRQGSQRCWVGFARL